MSRMECRNNWNGPTGFQSGKGDGNGHDADVKA